MKLPAITRAAAVHATGLSQRRAIIVAVAVLASERSMGPVSYTEIVLAAWELFPAMFSLPGEPRHPDSNGVSSKMVGRDGLVAKGLLLRGGRARTWRPQPLLMTAAAEVLGLPVEVDPPARAAPPSRPSAPTALLPEILAAVKRGTPWPFTPTR